MGSWKLGKADQTNSQQTSHCHPFRHLEWVPALPVTAVAGWMSSKVFLVKNGVPWEKIAGPGTEVLVVSWDVTAMEACAMGLDFHRFQAALHHHDLGRWQEKAVASEGGRGMEEGASSWDAPLPCAANMDALVGAG